MFIHLVLVILLPHSQLDDGDRCQDLHPRGERKLTEGLEPRRHLPVIPEEKAQTAAQFISHYRKLCYCTKSKMSF